MEQHIIPFNQGIHLTPSAAEDGQLLDCINLVPKDGALHNAPQLKQITGISFAEGHTLEFVHIPNTETTNYITSTKTTVSGHTTVSLWLQPVAQEDTAILTLDQDVTIAQITSVGNTIIVLASDGMHYLLWKQDAYVSLGTHMPEISIKFNKHNTSIEPESITLDATLEDDPPYTEGQNYDITDEDVPSVTQTTMGTLNKLIAEEVTAEGFLIHTHLIRYAFRLYDGSTLTMQSSPLVLTEGSINVHGRGTDFEVEATAWKIRYTFGMTNDIQDWKDIISSVDIFLSQPIPIYHQSEDITQVHCNDASQQDQDFSLILPADTEPERQEKIIETANFYLVDSIPVSEIDNSTHYLKTKGKLESLVNRERLPDDYDSHDQLIPHHSFVYNSRLNIANIEKIIFQGFTPQQMNLPYVAAPDTGTAALTIIAKYVHPTKEMVTKIVQDIQTMDMPDTFLYYNPSPYTKELDLYLDDDEYQHVELKSHPYLNGTYAFINMADFVGTGIPPEPTPTPDEDRHLPLPNKLYTSEVNNPFFFPVSGINTVGVGEIKGICAAVKALSQGQFGQFPLYVFSTDGVWALEVNSDGTYSVKQPVTRDVCNNPNSITQTDTAVLYATERGLHMLQGSETRLLSLALEAYTEAFDATGITIPSDFSDITSDVLAIPTPLLQQLDTAHISYDGINHIVHVYPDLTNAESVPSTHFILNLDSMEWTRTTQPIPVAFIDGYPNATLQVNETSTVDNVTTSVGKLYQYALPTFDNSPLHQGFILTSETALGAPLTYKILHDLRTLKHYHSAATSEHKVRIVPLVSNDRLKWYRLGSLKAASAIWYRFAVFTNMADSDILEALALITAPRRTNKIR